MVKQVKGAIGTFGLFCFSVFKLAFQGHTDHLVMYKTKGHWSLVDTSKQTVSKYNISRSSELIRIISVNSEDNGSEFMSSGDIIVGSI